MAFNDIEDHCTEFGHAWVEANAKPGEAAHLREPRLMRCNACGFEQYAELRLNAQGGVSLHMLSDEDAGPIQTFQRLYGKPTDIDAVWRDRDLTQCTTVSK